MSIVVIIVDSVLISQASHSNNWNKHCKWNITSSKNPSWREANQLAIHKRSRRIYNSGLPWNKSMKCSEWDSNPGPTDSKSNTLTTRPPVFTCSQDKANYTRVNIIEHLLRVYRYQFVKSIRYGYDICRSLISMLWLQTSLILNQPCTKEMQKNGFYARTWR